MFFLSVLFVAISNYIRYSEQWHLALTTANKIDQRHFHDSRPVNN